MTNPASLALACCGYGTTMVAPYPEGKPVKALMVQDCGKWTATVCYEVELPPRAEPDLVAAMDRAAPDQASVPRKAVRAAEGLQAPP